MVRCPDDDIIIGASVDADGEHNAVLALYLLRFYPLLSELRIILGENAV